MYFKKDFGYFVPWSGAVPTWDKIVENNMEEELEQLLEEMFCGDIPTDTQINDLLWFDSDWVLEQLGISEEEEEESEEE